MLALDLEETQEPPTTEDTALPRRPSEPLEPGERYRLGAQIARGGMGEVLTAHDADIGRDVAIKRLRAPNPTPLALARFLREARIQGRLDHPAIVPVHELAYDDNRRPFFVMKKLSGTTLAAILDAPSSRFTRHQLLRAFADVCLAVEFAHTRGVIHRDIKPANILLGDFGEVYVLDWGIARVATDRDSAVPEPITDENGFGLSTRPGAAIGTRGYMPPEQACGESIDERADVYALGCVLYEILTGHMLHPRGKHGVAAPEDARPSRSAPDVAPELDQLCMHATALHRSERLGSARELGEAVQRFLDGDRDLALRNRLARTHLDHALAAGDDEQGRRVAMREAGQALALDPTLGAAAELVGRLMIEPPKQMPQQVHAELATIDRVTAHRMVWNLLTLHVTFLVLIPVMWLFGVRDAFYGIAVAVLSLAGTTVSVVQLRTTRQLLGLHNVLLVVTFALTARLFTPFLIAPFAVAVNVVAFAFHPHATERKFWAFTLSSIGAVLAVWLAEDVGLLAPTMIDAGGALVLRSPLDGFSTFPAIGALAITFTAAIVASAVLARSTARFAHEARERVHLQAWQVRQLVPERD